MAKFGCLRMLGWCVLVRKAKFKCLFLVLVFIIVNFIGLKTFAMLDKERKGFPVVDFDQSIDYRGMMEFKLKDQSSKFYGFSCFGKEKKDLFMFIFPENEDVLKPLKYGDDKPGKFRRYKELKLNFYENSKSSSKMVYTIAANLHKCDNHHQGNHYVYVAKLDLSKFDFKKMYNVTLNVENDDYKKGNLVNRFRPGGNVFSFRNFKVNNTGVNEQSTTYKFLGESLYFVPDVDDKASNYSQVLDEKKNIYVGYMYKDEIIYNDKGQIIDTRDLAKNDFKNSYLGINYKVMCSGSKDGGETPDKFVVDVDKNSNEILIKTTDEKLNFEFYDYNDIELKSPAFYVLARLVSDDNLCLYYRLEIKLKDVFEDKSGFVPIRLNEPYKVIVKNLKGKELFRCEFCANMYDLNLETKGNNLEEAAPVGENFINEKPENKLCSNAIKVRMSAYELVDQSIRCLQTVRCGGEKGGYVPSSLEKPFAISSKITFVDHILYNYFNNQTECLS